MSSKNLKCHLFMIHLGNTVLVISGGFTGDDLRVTETISLGNPNLSCPDLPASPTDFLYPASFTRGDIPVACGGDSFLDTSCYQLIKENDGTWVWEVFAEMAEARSSSAFAQMDQDWFLAGTQF